MYLFNLWQSVYSLVGCPPQLSLPSLNVDDRNGLHVYMHFNDAVVLRENNQLDATDPDSVQYN